MATMLETVKSMIGVTGDYQDATLTGYIAEVKEYLLGAGVSNETVEAATSAGIIARGVTDLWNYGAGKGELSPYFKERAIQLASKSKSGSESDNQTDAPAYLNVNFRIVQLDSSNYDIKLESDRTFDEILNAYKTGLPVFYFMKLESPQTTFGAVNVSPEEGETVAGQLSFYGDTRICVGISGALFVCTGSNEWGGV